MSEQGLAAERGDIASERRRPARVPLPAATIRAMVWPLPVIARQA